MKHKSAFRPHTGAILIAVCCGVVFLWGLTACGGSKSKQSATGAAVGPMPYPVLKVDTATVTIYTDLAAELRSGVVVDIRPRVSGYLDKICVEEGTMVKKGQLLFVINQADFQASLSAAVANVDASQAMADNARLEIHKLTPLVQKGIYSQYELDNANSNLRAAEANLAHARSQAQNARLNLGYASIVSPVSGVVGLIAVRPGTLVNPSNVDPLTTVSGSGDMSAYFSINERTLRDLVHEVPGNDLPAKVAQMPPVTLITAEGSVYLRPGKPQLASGLVDMTTGAIQLKALFPNPEGTLRTGSNGVIRIPATLRGKILVPQKATYELQDKRMVYLLDSVGTVHSRNVTVAGASGGFYVIDEGLQRGDVILYEGLNKVRENQTILPSPLKSDSIYNTLRTPDTAVADKKM